MSVGMVEGVSGKAQSFFDDLVEQLSTDPASVYRRLMLSDNPQISTDKDRETASVFTQEAVARLSELPEIADDFVCPEHQCLASWCGCLDEYRRTHCNKCDTKLVDDGINMICPMCEWADDPNDPNIVT